MEAQGEPLTNLAPDESEVADLSRDPRPDAAATARPRVRSRRRRGRAERDSLGRILNLVRLKQVATRQEIERASGLGRAVVADRLGALIQRGLIEEGDLGASTGGRAPRLVRFRATAGHILVGSLGTTTLGVGIADLGGRLLVEHHEAGDITRGAEHILERLDEVFDWMLSEYPVARGVWGIGLAVPGPVGLAGGQLGARPTLHLMPGWADVPIWDHLSRRYGAPVWIDSSAHLMALGELRVGAGAGSSDLLFIKIGSGISAGLCANGQIHHGAHGYAGDIGHVAVSDDPSVLCRCGNTGCLEALAGGAAMGRAAQAAAADGRSPYLARILASGQMVTTAHVGVAAQLGDPFSVELLNRSGRLIGETLAVLVNGYNPSLVVIGGGVAQAGEILIGAIRDGIYRRSRSLATRDLRIVPSEMGKSSALVGAAFAAVDELFSPEHLRTWIDHGSPKRARAVSHDASRAHGEPSRSSTPRSRAAHAVTGHTVER